MDNTKYNGWMNYATWCVNLWLRNDVPSSQHWDQQAQDTLDSTEADDHRMTSAVHALADQLKAEVTDDATDLGATMYSDLLTNALCNVNWSELAEGFLKGKTPSEDQA